MAQTYYEVLGVPENATSSEIEAAFKSKAREVHPDKVPPGNTYLRKIAAEAFKDLSEAKSVLLNPTERRKYDSELAYMRGSEAFSSAPQPTAAAPPPPTAAQTSQTRAAPPKQQRQKYSFWGPQNSKFTVAALIILAVGLVLLSSGIADSERAVNLGLAFIASAFGLLCWRHGSRPTTDAAYLGGSVFLFIFAIVFFYAGLEPTSSDKPHVGPAPQSAGPIVSPSVRQNASIAPPAKRFRRIGSPERADKDPILAAIIGKTEDKNSSSALGSVTNDPHLAQHTTSPTPLPIVTPLHETPAPPPETERGQPDLSNLVGQEKQSIESACLLPKMNQGPAAYNECLQNQLAELRKAPRRPDLSSLNGPEHQSIESACLLPKMNQGPAAYNECLQNQPEALRKAPTRPDLSDLSDPELQSIESTCLLPKMNQGPAAYNECLQNQLAELRKAPRRPDLSSLSGPEQQSIESACLLPKMNQGPASYNRCLVRQLGLLRNIR